MNRRAFLVTSAAFAATPLWASTPYTPGLVTQALADGDTVFLDYKASWCGTCRAQDPCPAQDNRHRAARDRPRPHRHLGRRAPKRTARGLVRCRVM